MTVYTYTNKVLDITVLKMMAITRLSPGYHQAITSQLKNKNVQA